MLSTLRGLPAALTGLKFAWVLQMQVANYNMFRDYYTKNPATGFPPLPSVPITLPVNKRTLQRLCFMARYEPDTGSHLEEEDIQRTVAAMLDAARLLDQDQDVKEFQRAQQSSSGKAARTYILKRNGIYGARRQAKFTLVRHHYQIGAYNGDTGICSAVVTDREQIGTCGR